jgi:hypothetical protein
MSLLPIINSPLFNSSYFNSSNGYLTLTTGDQRYLRLGGVGTLSSLSVIGNLDIGSLSLGGSPISLSAISGITPGTAQPSKVLSLDGSGSISTITSLTSTTYYGTTANIQFMNTDILSAAINCNAPIFYALSANNTATTSTYQ